MAYALTLLAILGLFLWATPAQTAIVERLHEARGFTQEIASTSGSTLRAQAAGLMASVREKAMELLRRQLHGTVDELVK